VGDVLVPAIGLMVLVLLAVYASVTVVKQDEAIVIFRLGRTSADMVRGPGLHIVIPIVDRAVRVRLAEMAFEGTVGGVSKDEAAVTADLTIRWRVVDPFKSVTNLANVEAALKPRPAMHFRTSTGPTRSPTPVALPMQSRPD
jgi:regulator of protease activity HflC (stomatin/prohibitin superfamily)